MAKSTKKVVKTVLCVICIAVFAVSAYKIADYLIDECEARRLHDNMASQFLSTTEPVQDPDRQPDDTQPSQPPDNPNPPVSDPPEPGKTDPPLPSLPIPPVSVDFEALLAVNPEVVGWIYCEDTPINYPIAQGNDNSYYLTHQLDGSKNKHGTIFLDNHNAADFSDGNSVVYGHNMKNGKMFATLVDYGKKGYFEAHPIMWLLTPTGNYQIKIFSGYVTDIKDVLPYGIISSDPEKASDFITACAERSTFSADIDPTEIYNVITLSTCEYSAKNARYIIHGFLIPAADSAQP